MVETEEKDYEEEAAKSPTREDTKKMIKLYEQYKINKWGVQVGNEMTYSSRKKLFRPC